MTRTICLYTRVFQYTRAGSVKKWMEICERSEQIQPDLDRTSSRVNNE